MNPSPYPASFTSANLRARIVKTLLIVGAVVSCISLLAGALSLAFPPLTDEQELGDNPLGAAIMILIFLLAILDLILYLATVVFFLMWLHRAYSNLRAFDPSRRLNYSPGWAVGSFFVPFVNLAVPYRAVKEVWQKSGPSEESFMYEPGPPARFPIWWLFWILTSVAGNISMRASLNENVPENATTMIAIAADALSVVAAVFAYLVVEAINKRQEETSNRLNLGKLSGPPPPPANLNMLAPTPVQTP